MKIIRVVCTPDGICREPGDIIEKDFTPDECLVLTAAPEEQYVTQGAVVPGNGTVENDERKVQGRRIAGRLEPGAGTGYNAPVQEA